MRVNPSTVIVLISLTKLAMFCNVHGDQTICMVTCNTGRMRSSTLHVPALYAQVVYTTLIDSLVAWTFAASNASEQLSGFPDFQEET